MQRIFITGAASGIGAALGLVRRRQQLLQALLDSLCHTLSAIDRTYWTPIIILYYVLLPLILSPEFRRER